MGEYHDSDELVIFFFKNDNPVRGKRVKEWQGISKTLPEEATLEFCESFFLYRDQVDDLLIFFSPFFLYHYLIP